jgi:RNA polymerase sigma-70 factor (ECF subfamily)
MLIATPERAVDRTLIVRAQRGDREAFAELAAHVSDRLFAVAQRILRDSDSAGDALQSALVDIWRDLPMLRDPDRFDAWSHRVVVRRCYADRRRARRSIDTIALRSNDAVTSDVQASVALHDEIERAFRVLTAEQRAVLVLTYYRDMRIDEVAEVIGVSPGTVKSRLHYARQALRAAVEAAGRSALQEGRPA